MGIVEESLAVRFARTADGRILRRGDWQECVQVADFLLDAVTRGETFDDAVQVSGHSEDGRNVFDSITFTCANGSATYDFDSRDDYDIKMGCWSGSLRHGSAWYEEAAG